MHRRRFLSLALMPPVTGLGMIMPGIAQPYDQTTHRRLRFTFTFSNPFDRQLEQQVFWCYLPAQASSSQQLIGIHASIPHRLHSDPIGHRILELTFDRLPAHAQKVVNVTAEVGLAAESQAEELEHASSWLSAERFIESDDLRIRTLGSELRRPTSIETARAIYDWVKSNLEYVGYVAEDLGALQALLHRRGDCTEYADLVVALARANGIPARMVGGYVVDRDTAPRPQDYHNWAELYLAGAWRLVDAQKGNWLGPSNQYVTFRIYRDGAINAIGTAHRFRIHGDLQVTL